MVDPKKLHFERCISEILNISGTPLPPTELPEILTRLPSCARELVMAQVFAFRKYGGKSRYNDTKGVTSVGIQGEDVL